MYTKAKVQAPHTIRVDVADAVLRPLLPPLRRTVAEGRPVLAVNLWAPIPLVALLPFHLQLRWPDQVEGLPLALKVSIAPYHHADRALAYVPLYAPDEAYDQTRMVARWYRNEVGTALPGDLELLDWELGYRQHRPELRGKVLPGAAYVVIGNVQPSGEVRGTTRPILGRFASRRASRPLLLVPGRGADTEAAQERLAAATLAILNLQEVRSAQARRTMAALLALRSNSATLVVAASPSEILAFSEDLTIKTLPVTLFGAPPELADVSARIVGRDRLQEEVRFDEAITELRGYTSDMETILDLAEQAWWAARQSFGIGAATRDRLLWRYSLALERFRRNAPIDAGLLTSATNLLEQTIDEAGRAAERLEAILETAQEHLSRPSGWRTLIVVSQGADVVALREALGTHLRASTEDLHSLGIDIRSIHSVRSVRCDTLIVTGYQGMRSLDAALFTRARCARFVLDPIEARVALAHLARLRQLIERATWEGTQPDTQGRPARESVAIVLTKLHDALAAVAADTTHTRVSLDPRIAAIHLHERMSHDWAPAIASVNTALETATDASSDIDQRTLLAFTDGTSLLCAADRRMDVLDDSARGMSTCSACDLAPGDEVILLEQDSQALFSEQLMRLLDEGELREERARRDQWLLMAATARAIERRSIRSIQAGLRARGVAADLATIRTWLPNPDRLSEGLVPRTWREFRVLAEELSISLPEPALRDIFEAIRRWRTLHRVQGRLLVRIMRHAALGQLDGASLDRIQVIWGWKARDLVAGVHIRVVDTCKPW